MGAGLVASGFNPVGTPNHQVQHVVSSLGSSGTPFAKVDLGRSGCWERDRFPVKTRFGCKRLPLSQAGFDTLPTGLKYFPQDPVSEETT